MADDRSASYTAMNAAVAGRRESAVRPVLQCEKNKIRVRIVLKDDDFAIVKHKRYKLVVEGESFEGHTGAGGLVDHLVAEAATSGELSVWLEADRPPQLWTLDIGALDPLGIAGGAEGRLDNLGLDEGSGALPLSLEHEIGEFQRMFELERTSTLDGKTMAKLERVYSNCDEPVDSGARWVPNGSE